MQPGGRREPIPEHQGNREPQWTRQRRSIGPWVCVALGVALHVVPLVTSAIHLIGLAENPPGGVGAFMFRLVFSLVVSLAVSLTPYAVLAFLALRKREPLGLECAGVLMLLAEGVAWIVLATAGFQTAQLAAAICGTPMLQLAVLLPVGLKLGAWLRRLAPSSAPEDLGP